MDETEKARRAEIEQRSAGKTATFRLRDYLSPNGKYPYDQLARDMEQALEEDYIVYVYSVPGYMMVSGWPEPGPQAEPWAKTDGERRTYRTAAEALKG